MPTLTKTEWIAVTIAIVVVIIFMGSKFFVPSGNASATDQLNAVDQGLAKNILISTSTATTTNQNNVNQNTNAASDTSGLIIKDIMIGTGAVAKAGDLVSVQYTGKFADGKVFDSSIPRGQPIQFQLGVGQVIKGWDQGIAGMKVGGKRTLVIPASLGYGANGYPPVIPANATLYFDVQLTAVQAQ